MKKLITILTVLVLGFTAFAESAFERDRAYMESHPEEREAFQKAKEEKRKQRELEQELEFDTMVFETSENGLKSYLKGYWKLSSKDEIDVKYTRGAVTLTSGSHKCTIYVTSNEVYENGKKELNSYTKELLLSNGKEAHRLQKKLNK